MKMLKVNMQSTEGEINLFIIPLCPLSVNDPGKRTFAGNLMINWICSKLLLIS
jgi:hypothetical protein